LTSMRMNWKRDHVGINALSLSALFAIVTRRGPQDKFLDARTVTMWRDGRTPEGDPETLRVRPVPRDEPRPFHQLRATVQASARLQGQSGFCLHLGRTAAHSARLVAFMGGLPRGTARRTRACITRQSSAVRHALQLFGARFHSHAPDR
jgi:hypothetical protein